MLWNGLGWIVCSVHYVWDRYGRSAVEFVTEPAIASMMANDLLPLMALSVVSGE